MHFHRVMTVDLAGKSETVVEIPGRPSGLGWLHDGCLQVVSVVNRRLLRLDRDGLKEVTDLSNLVSSNCNDMVVDSQSRAYVGNFGFDNLTESFLPMELVLVESNGQARVVTDEMAFLQQDGYHPPTAHG